MNQVVAQLRIAYNMVLNSFPLYLTFRTKWLETKPTYLQHFIAQDVYVLTNFAIQDYAQ